MVQGRCFILTAAFPVAYNRTLLCLLLPVLPVAYSPLPFVFHNRTGSAAPGEILSFNI